MDKTPFEQIAKWQNSYVESGRYAGSSVLIHQNCEERFFSAVGLRDIETGAKFNRDTVVRLYSMTKPVTSLAVLMLIERGLLALDTPLNAVLSYFDRMQALAPNAERIDQAETCHAPTILHLLTHQAGFSYSFNSGLLPDEMNVRDFSMKPDQGTLKQRMSELSELPLAFKPGRKWEYSVATDVLGAVIEQVTGQSLDQFLRAEILDVLDMQETGFCLRDDQKPQLSTLYSAHDDTGFNVAPIHKGAVKLNEMETGADSAFSRTTLFSGGGGLVGTIDDYAKFTNMLLADGQVDGDSLVSPATARAMRANHLPGEIADMGPTSFAEQPMKGMGFGLGGSVLLDQTRAQTAGSVGDFSWGGIASTYFWIDPVQKLSVIFFTQLLPSSAYPSRSELKALVTGCLNINN
ncbi:beta-lactamase family protein [Epibacterium ulvae]|uniref:serine hydrolase domain-containing protein n=1 Tax=Epibacterium ulvae TaxID=1156985 RepID=UPI001BFCC6FF|nr:serine hydrolase domain-containing protein [Epibacterium ulvae]MBT8154431.1 beta-lactamase family protein [Epibacterium ulvae]